MDLNEYIKMSYKRPNRKVLEGLGASEDLIEYLMETPWNTNWNVVGSIVNSDSGNIGEIWFTGTGTKTEQDGQTFATFEVIPTDKADIERLWHRPQDCIIFINGEQMSPYDIGVDYAKYWFVGDMEDISKEVKTFSFMIYRSTPTLSVQIVPCVEEEISAEISVICDTTQPIVLQWTGTFKINGSGYENVLIPTDIENNMIPGLYNDTSEDNTLIRIGDADKTQNGISIYSNEEIYYHMGSSTIQALSNHINKYTAKVTIDTYV